MTEKEVYNLRFPIGEFVKPAIIEEETIQYWIEEIRLFPSRLHYLTYALTVDELNWKYRPNGWTIKQVVHHCADSHMNSVIRFKLSLTEDLPVIKPYYEDRWAELSDSLEDDISDSINLLTALHSKWCLLLGSINPNDLKREFIHPEHGTKVSIEKNIGIYAWHSNHHLAHIKQALDFKGQFKKEERAKT